MRTPKTTGLLAIEAGVRIVVSASVGILAIVAYIESAALRVHSYLFSFLLLGSFWLLVWSFRHFRGPQPTHPRQLPLFTDNRRLRGAVGKLYPHS